MKVLKWNFYSKSPQLDQSCFSHEKMEKSYCSQLPSGSYFLVALNTKSFYTLKNFNQIIFDQSIPYFSEPYFQLFLEDSTRNIFVQCHLEELSNNFEKLDCHIQPIVFKNIQVNFFLEKNRKILECKGVISAFLSIALLYCLLFRVHQRWLLFGSSQHKELLNFLKMYALDSSNALQSFFCLGKKSH